MHDIPACLPFHRRLLALLPHKDIGWTEIGEEFTRYSLLKTRWFAIYLHRLYCPNPHPNCHDHPWHFVAILLRGGYWEKIGDGPFVFRRPGSVLWRPALTSHNVLTYGVSWSIIICGSKHRDWGFHSCGEV